MGATMTAPRVNGKPIEFCLTAGVSEKYGGIEASLYINEMMDVLQRRPVSMYIFEMADETHMQIRCAGYDLPTHSELDEETIVLRDKSLKIETFWCKLDDYGDKYVGTFLFPHEW